MVVVTGAAVEDDAAISLVTSTMFVMRLGRTDAHLTPKLQVLLGRERCH